MLFAKTLGAKVIDTKVELDGAPSVAPETGSCGALVVSASVEALL